MADRAGQQLGNYRLIRLLGQGGFAEVYLGQHVHLHTSAAIKFLKMHLSQRHQEGFLREAEIVAHFRHQHIIRLLDFGIDTEENIPYLFMEYAPYGTLRDRHPKGSIVPLPTVAQYVKQTAKALQYAHDQHIIHRDLKPENVLVGNKGEILLSDFGVAATVHSAQSAKTGKLYAGTPTYSAPEQLRGHPSPASDQYSLAVMVYEWLSGHLPVTGSNRFEIARKHVEEVSHPLSERMPELPPAVNNVVMRALAKNPEQRFDSVREFATRFEIASSQEASAANSILLSPPPKPPITSANQPVQKLSPISSPELPITLAKQPGQQPLLGTLITAPITRRKILVGLGLAGLAVISVVGGSRLLTPAQQPVTTTSPPTPTSIPSPTPSPTTVPTSTPIPSPTPTPSPMPTPSPLPLGTLLYTYPGPDWVLGVVWSPDGRRIASASHYNTVKVWDATDGGHVLIYRGHSDWVYAVAWSPDGRRIASASRDSTVQVWDAASGGHVFTYRGHSDWVNAVAWSPDSTRIASASFDKTVQVWDAAGGGHVFTYRGHSDAVWSVAWSPDGRRIASGSKDKTVQAWDAAGGGNVFSYHGHSGPVEAVAWSPDGKRIASGSNDKTVHVWDAANGGNVFTYRRHTDIVYSVAWSLHGRRIASGSADKTVHVWDAANGGNVFTYRRHTDIVDAVAWSPDGTRIASGSNDRTVQVWQAV